MEKNKSNWWIDLILFSLFWISFFPDFTGLEIHQWLGIAAMGIAAWHLIAHWTWVETVTMRFFSRTSLQARVFYIVDAGAMLGFWMILLTGLLISTWLNLPLYDLAAWTYVHLMASVFTLGMVVAKIVLHWRWVATAARRYVFDPVFSRSNTGARVHAVDRRDFLKLAGVLGAAAVVTIHGLFDDAQEAQAQSAPPGPAGDELPQPTAGAAATPQPLGAGGEPSAAASTSTQAAPTADLPTVEPAVACTVLCPNGCSYPGRCRRYVDRNDNGLCDNGECL